MNSPIRTSPIPDLIRLLDPIGARWGTIRARGRWALSFPVRDDLLFFRVDRGICQVATPSQPPLTLGAADYLFVRTCASLVFASDVDAEPIDSWSLIRSTRSTEIRVGDAGEETVVIRGGRLMLNATSNGLMTCLIPPVLHLRPETGSWDRVRSILAIMEAEALEPGPLTTTVEARLVELLLLQLFNEDTCPGYLSATGLLAGLADPVLARALAAMHGDIARSWTVALLARLCGCSRAGLAERFARMVGLSPIAYLRHWRIAVAKDELRQGKRGIAQIALLVGFQSASAFSSAFSRATHCSPTEFAELGETTRCEPPIRR